MSDLATEAKALRERYGALLNPAPREPRYGNADHIAAVKAEAAAKALDAARERLQGGRRPDAPQLILDLGGRP